jgi:hypothetical protein
VTCGFARRTTSRIKTNTTYITSEEDERAERAKEREEAGSKHYDEVGHYFKENGGGPYKGARHRTTQRELTLTL